MEATVVESPVSESLIAQREIVYPVREVTISEMGQRMLSLKIAGVNDKKGAKAVQEAKMECVRARTAIEKKRKELKADSLEYGRKVDTVAKTLTAMIEPIEQHLIGQQEAIEQEMARIAQAKADEIYAQRVAKLKEYGATAPEAFLRSLDDAEFDQLVESAIRKMEEEKERKRLAAEEAERNRIEAERLAKERAEYEARQAAEKAARDKLRSRLNALAAVKSYPEEDDVAVMADSDFDAFLVARTTEWEQVRVAAREAEERAQRNAARMNAFAAVRYYPDPAEVAAMNDATYEVTLNSATAIWEEKQAKEAAELAEQQRIAEEQAERERQEALRIAREEAAEQARIETEARIKREAEVREQQRLAEEALAAKQAALRPARDKLAAFSSAIGQVQQPQISVEVDRRILTLINNLQKAIQKIADELE